MTAQTRAHPLDLAALMAVPHVDPYGGYEVSPDGTRVAFAWNRTGHWEIYEAPLDRALPPRQISRGPGAKLAPCYSPGGRHLAYAVDADGSEAYDLYVCDLETGEQANLTPHSPGALQPDAAWAPAARAAGVGKAQLAFLAAPSGHFSPHLVGLGGGDARRLWRSPSPAYEVDWSPDGRWLAVMAETGGQDYGISLVSVDDGSLESGEVRVLGDARGPLNARDGRWAPLAVGGDLRLAFVSDARGAWDVGIYDLSTGQIDWLPAGDGDRASPAWAPDGGRLAWVESNGPRSRIAVRGLETGLTAHYELEPGIHHAPHFTPGGDALLVAVDSPRRPTDLWLLSLAESGGSWRQISHSLPPELAGAPFVVPETVHYPSLDGQPVPALLYRAPGAVAPGPAVVVVHGGPNWLSQITWDPAIQHMVSRGWTVLAPNYRGSTGYGRRWQLANRFDLGGGDTRDVVAGAGYLVREGLAAARRIAVTGRSHGGYLTMTALTGYPDRWAGGSAVVPFLNWFTSHENAREDVRHWDMENMGDPELNHDLWRERSPFFFLDRIQAPVQLICGAHDVRCPAVESLQARDILEALGKEVSLTLYPDEGHDFRRLQNVIDAEKRRAAFLAALLER
jgi:dipeptidyl aminopeptidase/acylaminoacyl peptidase